MKSQDVRLVDILLLGPFMVWFAREAGGVAPWARAALAVAGIATVAYNGRNYLEAR